MYARACRSWYGATAKSVVRAKIRALKAKGDVNGVEAWERVARALVRLETDQAQPRAGKPNMTSRQLSEAVSHLLKTRHGMDVTRRRVAKMINGNPLIDEKMAPRDIAILIKSYLGDL